LTIKSTSHTKPASGLLRPRYSGSDLDQHAAHERYFFALHILCLINARQYSVVKDRLDFKNPGVGSQEVTMQSAFCLLTSYFWLLSFGGPG